MSRLEEVLAERRAKKEKQQRILEEERQRYHDDLERLKQIPVNSIVGLEDFRDEDFVTQHRYEKYVDGVLRKMQRALTDGYMRDNTTFECAIALIELAAADWNDFTFQEAQRFLRTYAPKRGRPHGGPDDLPVNFLEQKWKSAAQTWKQKGSKPRERPASNMYDTSDHTSLRGVRDGVRR